MHKLVMTLVVIVFWAGLYLFVPILSPYASSLGADLSLVGLVVGSYGITQLLLRIPTGWLADRLGRRKPFVIFGFAITAVSSLMMYWAPSPWYLVIGRGLSGVAATMWVMLAVLIAGTFPANQAVAAMGLASFANNLGQISGTAVGGWVAETWGWGAPFLVSAGIAVVGLLLISTVAEKRLPAGTPVSLKALFEALSNRRLLWVCAISALMQYLTWVTVFGFTPVYAQSLGASRVELGWLTVAGLVPQALISLATGRLATRWGAGAILLLGTGISTLATAAIPYMGTMFFLTLVQMLGGLGRGLTNPLLMGLSIETVPVERRAMIMGIFQSIYALGMFLGPVVAGRIGASFGPKGLFLSTSAVGLLAVVGVVAGRHLLDSRLRRAADWTKVKA